MPFIWNGILISPQNDRLYLDFMDWLTEKQGKVLFTKDYSYAKVTVARSGVLGGLVRLKVHLIIHLNMTNV